MALIVFILGGCTSKQERELFEYSNLVDPNSQNEVMSMLSQAGVSDNSIELFFSFVDEFYKVPYEGIVKKDFVEKTINDFTYEVFSIEENAEHWKKLGFDDNALDINCRVAAFTLTEEFVYLKDGYVKPTEIIDDTLLDKHHLLDYKQEEKEKYALLFNDLSVGVDKSKTEVVESIIMNWRNLGVNFENDMPVKLISFFIQDKGSDTVKVAHAAAMLETENNKYLMEKYNPQEPYQVSKFSETAEIISYLLQRLNQDKLNTSQIIIMSNEEHIY